jgi:hypothetical protein
MTAEEREKRPRFQFGIRGLLVLTALLAAYLAVGRSIGSMEAWLALTLPLACSVVFLFVWTSIVHKVRRPPADQAPWVSCLLAFLTFGLTVLVFTSLTWLLMLILVE